MTLGSCIVYEDLTNGMTLDKSIRPALGTEAIKRGGGGVKSTVAIIFLNHKLESYQRKRKV